ncbi:unnamed protein product [Zymoseptoria tritici ST99CH_3D1]|uniref:Uncharacterized protein n=1 Tax=Zymoseptoria tritici ST99CH_1E4 TaxID=1276532 RepID=A0A2H1H9A8_ZYMTR|nr:unnamed protein product [Zymoseptoria tritici ST99CH_1E4]SMR64877.1 unnamed protein product [Zymoseptoria tritici ST99CH_3D1]
MERPLTPTDGDGDNVKVVYGITERDAVGEAFEAPSSSYRVQESASLEEYAAQDGKIRLAALEQFMVDNLQDQRSHLRDDVPKNDISGTRRRKLWEEGYGSFWIDKFCGRNFSKLSSLQRPYHCRTLSEFAADSIAGNVAAGKSTLVQTANVAKAISSMEEGEDGTSGSKLESLE